MYGVFHAQDPPNPQRFTLIHSILSSVPVTPEEEKGFGSLEPTGPIETMSQNAPTFSGLDVDLHPLSEIRLGRVDLVRESGLSGSLPSN